MTRKLFIIFAVLLTLFCRVIMAKAGEEQSQVRFVSPMIGTAPSVTPSALRHGQGTENSAQVIPEVTAPFGMTNWTPQTRHGEAKCVAPYAYADSVISGFRGSHWLSGSCTQDYGSMIIMAVAGTPHFRPLNHHSHFRHSRETSTPYYYSVTFDDDNILGELTATARCGLCRFTFGSTDSGSVVIEPNSDFGEGYVRILPASQEIEGYNPVHRIYQGWGEPAGFKGYFVARFSEAFAGYGVYDAHTDSSGVTEGGKRKGIGACVRFAGCANKRMIVRIGTSFTSLDEARNNLESEAARLDFDQAKDLLKKQWNDMLSRVAVTGGSETAKVKFYTALYHAYLQPRTYNDVDGSYPSFSGGDSICNSGGHTYYCDYSMWDTYRALHPMFNMVIPEINADMVRSLLVKARQGGWLPTFPCWNSYTSAMIGDHAIAVIADAFVKGVISLNDEDYRYLKKNATEVPEDRKDYLQGKGVRALDSYMRMGYIPLEDSVKESFHKGEQVSRTLEYAFDDFALSQIAGKLGKNADRDYFFNRSRNYRNVFSRDFLSVCGRHADGSFARECDRTQRMPYITEGTPWQYTWYVPQDVEGLMTLFGGRTAFENNLDLFFAAGQYWHGNEPDQQAPFLYTYTRHPEKTDKLVRQILEDEYSAAPGGLSGNDDAGQISAWYVMASMGLYSVCPSRAVYAVTAPAFDTVTVSFANGKTLTISANGVSAGRSHIVSITFNGRKVMHREIAHADLIKGGALKFTMTRGEGDVERGVK